MEHFSLDHLKNDALAIRRKLLGMHFTAHSGHIGTGLSMIEIITYLHRTWLGQDDDFILSKGHGAACLYATLNHMGKLSDETLATYYQDGTLLPAHPVANALASIPVATGSLGHGLSIGVGMAYVKRHVTHENTKTVCLLSDGECNEGSVWEAAMFAAHHGLGNLTVVVDANGLQGFGRTEDVLNLEPLEEKWRAFGFDTDTVDGHDFAALDHALRQDSIRPRCVVAKTKKGKGISFMENKLEWHYLPMTDEQYKQALWELNNYAS